jgi:high-affinity iron transporter
LRAAGARRKVVSALLKSTFTFDRIHAPVPYQLRGITCLLALFAAPTASLVEAPAADAALRQVAGILDYIAGDYRAAVGEDGAVLDDAEYREQLSLVSDAASLASQAGLAADDPVRRDLAALAQELAARRSPGAIASRCRAVRDAIVRTHRVVLSPRTPPRRDEGARLYHASGCASCHGEDGSADTETARTLDPRPANFLDPERVATVSPHRAFFAITFGVSGTGMTAYPALSDAERWDLAFYVLSLRHGPDRIARGRAVLSNAPPAFDVSPQGLSALGEEDILARLGGLRSAADREAALAYLRATAPFEAVASAGGANGYDLARRRIDEALAAYRSGRRDEARRLLVSAYLDGFEPHEAALAARDPAFVREVERAMFALRDSVARGVASAEVEARGASAHALLARAAASRGADRATAFAGALTITLREGIEAALLIVALIGIVRRQGLPHLARFVHAGWLLAVPAGAVTWFALGSVLGGLERELAEGIAALVAAVVLLGVTHWVIGQATAKRFMGALAEQIDRAARGRMAALGILGLSFLAAYREAFEVVLFFHALLLDAAGAEAHVGFGIAAGAAALVAVALGLRALGKRLKPRSFLMGSGALLALLAFVLAGKGIRALQEAGVLSIRALPLPEMPALGIHATVAGLATQALVLGVIVLSALLPVVAARRQAAP